MEDGAQMAARACAQLIEAQGGSSARCRVDFDTSVGDETFPILKQSTEFMQNLVTGLCYLNMPELQQLKQNEMMRVVTAKSEKASVEKELEEFMKSQKEETSKDESTDESTDNNNNNQDDTKKLLLQKLDDLEQIIARNGVDPEYRYEGPRARIYFPDEGNAALAKRDWLGASPKVPPCVEFSSCGGVQSQIDPSNDKLIFFFCPRASESEYVEDILRRTETAENTKLQLSVFVNPLLVDMGVTGFGMAGRLLRERLIDPLPYAYYLRTLPWGALTRVWPQPFSVWQEDDDAEGGYRLIRTLSTLPSNPEVEDIYDIENGNMAGPGKGGGMLDQFGDFVNGMMRL